MIYSQFGKGHRTRPGLSESENGGPAFWGAKEPHRAADLDEATKETNVVAVDAPCFGEGENGTERPSIGVAFAAFLGELERSAGCC